MAIDKVRISDYDMELDSLEFVVTRGSDVRNFNVTQRALKQMYEKYLKKTNNGGNIESSFDEDAIAILSFIRSKGGEEWVKKEIDNLVDL